MAGKTYVDWDSTNGRLQQHEGITTSAGAADGDKIVATDPVTGQIHTTLIPDVSAPTITIEASATIADRSVVNIHSSTGRKVRPAIASDGTKPASAYVETGGAAAANLTVQLSGVVTFNIGATGITVNDVDKGVFLDTTSGLVTKTPPSATGNIVQWLGKIIEVDTGNSVFKVAFNPHAMPPIVMV